MSEKVHETSNGAAIFREPKLGNKWAVAAPDGTIVGYRRDRERALEFAATLKGEKLPVPEPRVVSVSPRADPSLRGREV